MDSRILNEIEHGKKIGSNAEQIWNWASPAGQVRAERRANYLVDVGQITKSDKVLEIGCGTGLFTNKIYNKTGANIIATDISEDLLKIAKSKSKNIEYMEDNAMKMKFEDSQFDVVCGSSILHHLDLDIVLKEISRVLKPGGRLIFAEPNMINPQIFIQKNIPFVKKYLGDSPDETAIVRWKFKKQLSNHMFQDIKIFPYDFLHPVTPKFLIKFVNSIGMFFEKIPLIKEIAGSVVIYAVKK